MVLDAADTARVGNPDHHRQPDPAAGAVAHLRDVAHDLLERRVGERVELHLDYRPPAVHGHPDRHPDDARLRQRGVETVTLTECGGEPVGHPEHPAQRSDVLPENDDALVGGHRVAQRGVDRLRHGHLY